MIKDQKRSFSEKNRPQRVVAYQIYPQSKNRIVILSKTNKTLWANVITRDKKTQIHLKFFILSITNLNTN